MDNFAKIISKTIDIRQLICYIMDFWQYLSRRSGIFPSEMVILMAIAVARDPDEKLLTRPLDVIGEYISYLCSSLIRRGYLKGKSPRGYLLTAKGMRTLFEFLSNNKNKAEDTIKMLHQLGIEIEWEIGKLERETIGVE